jgi:trigger factor
MSKFEKAKSLPGARKEYAVSFDEAELMNAEKKALTLLADQVRIPGFRPGKASPEMVKERVRKEDLLEETIRMLLPEAVSSIMEKEQLKPIMPPKVEVTSASPLAVSIRFIEKPEVTVKGLEKLAPKKEEVKVDAKDVDRMVDYLLQQHRTTGIVTRPAAEKDEVTMDFSGTDEHGKEIPGTKAEDYKVVIGSKSLIPGFEEALKGLSAGGEKTFQVTFPQEYHAEHLKGKPATFAVKVKSVAEVHMPALTDEFVKEKKMGESAAAFRAEIEKTLRDQEEHMNRQKRESAMFEALAKATTVDLAPELIETEARALAEDLGNQLDRNKLTLEAWLAQQKKTPQQLKEEMENEAKRRLTLRFGLEKALEMKKIEVTDDEMKTVMEEAKQELSQEERISHAAEYATGGEAYERIKWQKTVEKFLKEMLG